MTIPANKHILTDIDLSLWVVKYWQDKPWRMF